MNGTFTFGKNTRIVIAEVGNENLQKTAEILQEYLQKMLGKYCQISNRRLSAGDIFLYQSKNQSVGDEGYYLEVKEVFYISVPQYCGMVFETRTLLQLIEQNRAMYTLPRDYPTYEVRGFMLDVG